MTTYSLYEEYEDYVKKYQKEYGKNTVVLYRCGSFYEIYSANDEFVDMKKLSELLNIQVSRRNKAILQVDRSNFKMAGFPMFALKKFVNMLIDASYTVVIVDQITGPPKPKRAVTEIISPGTKIDDINTLDSNMLLVAYFEDHTAWRSTQTLLTVGVSLIDLTTGKSKIAEYSSTPADPTLALDELYKTLSFYTPKEIILSSAKPIQHTLEYLTTYLEIGQTCIHDKLGMYPDAMQKINFQEQMLQKIFPKHGLLSIFEYLELERSDLMTKSYIYMLEFCQKHNENIIKQILPPEMIGPNNSHLLLSYNTCKQLNLTNLMSILNICQTAIGRRAFKDRILVPMTDPEDIIKSYDKIDEFCTFYKTTSSHLNNIYDIERLYRRLILKKLHPSDLSQIDDTLKAVITLSETIPFDEIDTVQSLMNEYRAAIDLQEVQKYHLDNITVNFFNQGTYVHLDELQSKHTKLRSFFDVLAKNIHLEFCKVDYNDRDGYYITITSKRFNDIKADLKNKKFRVYEYTIPFENITAKPVSSSSTSLRLTDNKIMRKVNQEIQEVQEELSKEFLDTYLNFLGVLAEKYGEVFNPIARYIIDIDWYTSCAKNVMTYKYTRPIIQDTYQGHSYIKATKLRHPIIERILSKTAYIANDIMLGTPEINGMLLYGINSAGKSTISTGIGLIIIMAQAGMYVPCDEFVYWPYKEIFTRIPSGDNMMKGQSTFVVEISELRNILKRAKEHSLVIGDELASGTESVSALAIVSAGILELYNRKTSFIFATHLHDLCEISHIKALKNLGVYHMSVTYDSNTEKLIYDRILKEGQGSTVYGLEVCKSLNLPDEFLKLANEIRQEVLDVPQLHSHKQSRYNAKLFVDTCAICKEKAQEVHHIEHQAAADEEGFIGHIHKNNLSNLMAVCGACHDKIHAGTLSITGYVQTSDGVELIHKEDMTAPSNEEQEDLSVQIMEMKRGGSTLKAIKEKFNISMYKLKKILAVN